MAGYFVRVVRGNVEQAVRQLNRVMAADPQSKVPRGRPFHEKPTAYRRRKREERLRRSKNAELFENLQIIFARKARGF